MDTVETREQGLDKFYTLPHISKKCIDSIENWNKWGLVVEPSAGDGSFLNQIPTKKKIGLDILPEHTDVLQQDFFSYSPPENTKKILVIGNPPFGKVSSLAIRFFNHAAEWADMIAFIIPRTFRRVSVQNKLNTQFHLIHDEEIPTHPCSFTPQMSVKCCFQVWEKKRTKRKLVQLPTTHEDWEFLKLGPKDENNQPTPPEGADFAIRAYGGRCGDIVTENLHELRPKSWHWIKCKDIPRKKLIKKFKSLDYTISLDTARQNSVGKADLVYLYSNKSS
ncbi:hypothetical protein N9C10_03610 [Flavobacteriaceae bacterium]|nr:hypothetical protein [Flavobacteriaceae bacterium]